ncbi:MAG TPA: hypothetical protein PKD64_18810, partial [Pirellulaceae bacterium]|nr:hypothetical protein [Pirellulaceae bacterium]HMO94242.1 hypothetical protein [Pirellulaceae bacterium]
QPNLRAHSMTTVPFSPDPFDYPNFCAAWKSLRRYELGRINRQAAETGIVTSPPPSPPRSR